MRRLNLTRLVLSRDPERPFPGDRCPVDGCDGRITVYAVRQNPALGVTTRYLECATCGHKPDGNKFVTSD